MSCFGGGGMCIHPLTHPASKPIYPSGLFCEFCDLCIYIIQSTMLISFSLPFRETDQYSEVNSKHSKTSTFSQT